MELRFAPESEVAPKLRLGEYNYQYAKDLEDLSCVIEEDGVCLGGENQCCPGGGAADDRPLMGEFGLSSQGTGKPPDCGG